MIRRTLFRLWVIGSVLWFALTLTFPDWHDNVPRALALAFGFPLAFLAAGVALRWAFGGYRQGA